MAKPTGDRSSALTDGPSDVQITITVRPRADPTLPGQLAAALARRRTKLAVALAGVAVAATIAGALEGDRAVAGDAGAAAAPGAQRAAIAAAYGYPLRCLSITVSASNRAYATARLDRRPGCERYDGYVNASFHHIGGGWRLVLDEGQLFVPNGLLAPDESR
jgi:hypothetical protein